MKHPFVFVAGMMLGVGAACGLGFAGYVLVSVIIFGRPA